MKNCNIKILTDKDYNTGPLNWHTVEKLMIKSALTRVNGHKKKTSLLLDITERTLYRKIIQHSIPKKYGKRIATKN